MFAVVVVLTLAVGIGVNVAVFSMFDRLMLRELNVANPRELVKLVAPGSTAPSIESATSRDPATRRSATRCSATSSAPARRSSSSPRAASIQASLGRDGEHDGRLRRARVGRILRGARRRARARARARRAGRRGRPRRAVVLSYDYWQTAYARGSRRASARRSSSDGHPLTIVGVAPRGFVGTTPGARPDVFAPLTLEWFSAARRRSNDDRLFYYAYVFGRLKPGVSLEQAQAALNATYRAIVDDVDAPLADRTRPGEFDIEAFRATSLSLASGARGQTQAPDFARTPLAIFFAATATILLIGCVNLANLMFARGAARVGEIAVRASLGAARRRLVALLSVEALLLAGFAARRELAGRATACCARSRRCSRRARARAASSLDWRAVAAAFAIARARDARVRAVADREARRDRPRARAARRAARAHSAARTSAVSASRSRRRRSRCRCCCSCSRRCSRRASRTSRASTWACARSRSSRSVVAPSLNGYSRRAAAADRSRRSSASSQREPGVTHVSSATVALLAIARVGHRRHRRRVRAGRDARGDWRQRQPRRHRFLRDARDSAARRPRFHGRRLARPAARRDRQRELREALRARRQPRRQADRLRRPAARSTSRSSGSCATRRTAASRGSSPRSSCCRAGRTPSPARAHVLRAHGAAARERCWPPCRASSRASTRVCPSSRRARSIRRCAATCGTDWLLVTLVRHARGRRDAARGARPLRRSLLYGRAAHARDRPAARARRASPRGVRRMVLKQVGWMAGIGVPIGLVAALLVGNVAASFLFGLAPTDPRRR